MQSHLSLGDSDYWHFLDAHVTFFNSALTGKMPCSDKIFLLVFGEAALTKRSGLHTH